MRTLLLRSLFAAPVTIDAPAPTQPILEELGFTLAARARRLFGRSLTIREVDAGSCNGCELEIHALNNAVYDIERFGMRFVASPRVRAIFTPSRRRPHGAHPANPAQCDGQAWRGRRGLRDTPRFGGPK